jgi:two-component system, NarL family, sensor kinase
MQDSRGQVVITIVAVVIVLLFIGILFLVMLSYYNNKKAQMAKEQRQMKDAFDKQLLQSKLEIQEQTLNGISQEIHDNVGQILSLAKVQLNIMDQRSVMDPELIADIKQHITRAMTDLRDVAKSLSTVRVQQVSLHESIAQELGRINKSGFVAAKLEINGTEKPVAGQQKLIVFRIVQESLQNIIKHAGARQLEVGIHYRPAELQISIHDDGSGFEVEKVLVSGGGLGLQNIIHRAALIGGHAKINSGATDGTTIVINIPYA